MKIEINKIYNECCLETMGRMPDGFVDMVICSPPYWGLRDYGTAPQIWDNHNGCEHEWGNGLFERKRGNASGPTAQVGNTKKEICGTGVNQGNFCTKCNAWKGNLGLEPDYNLFIDHLVQIFDEVKRVLKDTGSCWVNLGDSYSGSNGAGYSPTKWKRLYENETSIRKKTGRTDSISPKSLIGIPERFVLAMQDNGWIRRNTIIWHKKNCMPSSASDRFTVDFEYLYFFTKKTKYYFEQQFEEFQGKDESRWSGSYENEGSIIQGASNRGIKRTKRYPKNYGGGTSFKGHSGNFKADGSLIGTPELGRNKRCVWKIPTQPYPGAHFAVFPAALIETPIKGGCPVDGIVYDPFMGAATTAEVALTHNRHFIGSERSVDYCKIGNKRIKQELAQERFSL